MVDLPHKNSKQNNPHRQMIDFAPIRKRQTLTPSLHKMDNSSTITFASQKSQLTIKKTPIKLGSEDQKEIHRRELARRELERRVKIRQQMIEKRREEIEKERRAEKARAELRKRQAEEEEKVRELESERQQYELRKQAEHKRILEEERKRQDYKEQQARSIAARRQAEALAELRRRKLAEQELSKRRPVEVAESKETTLLSSKPKNPKIRQTFGNADDFVAEFDRFEKKDQDFPSMEDLSLENLNQELDKIDEFLEEDTSKNNTSYILGGKSPFINTDKIEKRPLSGRQRSYEPISHKNIYENKRSSSVKSEKVPTVVVPEDKKSNFVLAIAIILTILLGTGIGAIVYFALFNQ